MSNQNKGFDPLSSLFDAPPLDDDFLFDEEGDEQDPSSPPVNITDPVFSPPPGVSPQITEEIELNVHTEEQAFPQDTLASEALERSEPLTAAPPSADTMPSGHATEDAAQDATSPNIEVPLEEQARIARELAQKAMLRAKPPEPSEPTVTPEDQARIARELAQKAMQQASQAAPPPAAPVSRLEGLRARPHRGMTALEAARLAMAAEEAEEPSVTPEQQARIARDLAQKAMLRASFTAPSVTPEEQARIARDLAQKAMLRANSSETPVAPEEQVRIARALAERALSAAPVPEPDPEPPAPRTLSERAQRPMTALEAARVAAQQEEQQSERQRQRRVSKLTERVRQLVPASLPGLGKHKVANAIVTDERDVLVALWRAHRSRFLSEGRIERAVSAATVLHALEHCPTGMLIAAHVVTEVSDYLVWIDMKDDSLIAAFPDARAWFAS